MKGYVSSHNVWVSQGNLCHMTQYKPNSHTTLGGSQSVRKAVEWASYQGTTTFQEFPEHLPEEEQRNIQPWSFAISQVATSSNCWTWNTALV